MQRAEGSAGFSFQTAGGLAPQGGTNQLLLCLDEMEVYRIQAGPRLAVGYTSHNQPSVPMQNTGAFCMAANSSIG